MKNEDQPMEKEEEQPDTNNLQKAKRDHQDIREYYKSTTLNKGK